jgi:hypothetical protein
VDVLQSLVSEFASRRGIKGYDGLPPNAARDPPSRYQSFSGGHFIDDGDYRQELFLRRACPATNPSGSRHSEWRADGLPEVIVRPPDREARHVTLIWLRERLLEDCPRRQAKSYTNWCGARFEHAR